MQFKEWLQSAEAESLRWMPQDEPDFWDVKLESCPQEFLVKVAFYLGTRLDDGNVETLIRRVWPMNLVYLAEALVKAGCLISEEQKRAMYVKCPFGVRQRLREALDLPGDYQ